MAERTCATMRQDYHRDVCQMCDNISPTPYKISTITATGDVNVNIDLDAFFCEVPLRGWHTAAISSTNTTKKKQQNLTDCEWGFVSVQFVTTITTETLVATSATTAAAMNRELLPISYSSSNTFNNIDNNRIINCREMLTLVRRSALDANGVPLPVQQSSRRKRRPARHFDNQCTLIYWEKERIDAGFTRGVNVKCFRNGRIQMTGVRHVEEGERVLSRVVETIRALGQKVIKVYSSSTSDMVPLAREEGQDEHDDDDNDDDDKKIGKFGTRDQLFCNIVPFASTYKICLINSDFNLGFNIRRDILHTIISQKYGVIVSFEPCIYPGVKVSFMWNHQNTSMNIVQDGVCKCQKKCRGNGNGYGAGDCRRVTCAIFQSGCTIITGAHSYTQLEDTYSFVCRVASTHREAIERSIIPPI